MAGQIHCIDYDGSSCRFAIGVSDMVQIATETAQGMLHFTLLQHSKRSVEISGKLTGSFRLSPPIDISCVGDDKRIRPRGLHFYERGMKVIVTYLNHGVV